MNKDNNETAKGKPWYKDFKNPVFYYVFTPILILVISIIFNVLQLRQNRQITDRLERLENSAIVVDQEETSHYNAALQSSITLLDISEPSEMLKRFQGLTGIQVEERFENTYKNQYVKWRGLFINVYRQPFDVDTVYMIFFKTSDERLVAADFDKTWRSRIVVLQIGDSITVQGKLKSIDLGIFLEDCALIDD